MAKNFEDFKRLYPLSKTLRFEAKPIGATLKNIIKSGLLDEDEHRAASYVRVLIATKSFIIRFVCRMGKKVSYFLAHIDSLCTRYLHKLQTLPSQSTSSGRWKMITLALFAFTNSILCLTSLAVSFFSLANSFVSLANCFSELANSFVSLANCFPA